MKLFKRCYRILKRTGTLQIFLTFLLFLLGASAVLTLIEPEIDTLGDGIWYCFVTAMVPGVVVSYYMEYLKIREKETLSLFFEKLERLPELSREDLTELSAKIKEVEKGIR